ncbi:MAG: hypothetical protein JWP75_290 [Frondihabitans sp.]|nr:hypothetical protein [Frondihabitans sp.]
MVRDRKDVNSRSHESTARKDRIGQVIFFAVLLVLQVIISFFAYFVVTFLGMTGDSCAGRQGSDACNYGVLDAIPLIMFYGSVVAVAVSVVWGVARERHRNGIWWIPLIPTGAVVALAFGCAIAGQTAIP